MLPLIFIGIFLLLWAGFHAALPPLWRLLSKLANQAAALTMRSKRVQRLASGYVDYLPVALVMLLGLSVAVVVGEEFIDLAELVRGDSPQLTEVDSRIHQWAAAQRRMGATPFFNILSVIGGPLVLAIMVALITLALIFLRRYRWAIYLVVTTTGGGVANALLKLYFARARPDLAVALRQAHGFSFPSGHAMGSMIVFGAISYLVFRTASRWRWKSAALALATTLIVSIALSRVYLGVHWLSDVGAGLAAGLVWVVSTTIAYETTRRIRLLRALRRSAAAK